MSADDVFFWANWTLVAALVLGVLATYAIVVSGNTKERALRRELADAGAVAETARENAARANERAASLETQAAEANERAANLESEAAQARAEIARAQAAAEDAAARAAEANARAAEANRKAEEERLARVKIEARIAPRSMTQAQQDELTERLSKVEKQRGTIIASPSTPESEMFARALGAPLRAAGWDIGILPGTATATHLYPTGVIIEYVDAPNHLIQDSEATGPGIAATTLAQALAELGIGATALATSSAIWPPNVTVRITISTK